MADNLHVRTAHTSTWASGPDLGPYDLEMLLDEFGQDGYHCYACDEIGHYYYDVSAEDITRIVAALSNMTYGECKSLSWEDEGWLEDGAKETLIDELQFIYDNRDMNWGDGDWILLGWY